ncbi:MAG: hypothetical protein IE926_20345, partial [Micrococcales bacterium]|nr:hypothetical protein [Micrococcales bacterium]
MSRRTREDELAARVQVAAVILGVLIIYALAAWFGYTHPAGNSWAIPALFVALLALSAAAAIRAA